MAHSPLPLTKYTTLRQITTTRIEPVGLELLRRGEVPKNVIYGTSQYAGWFDGVLSGLAAVDGHVFERYEEVERFYREWMLNKDAGNVKRLQPTGKGLWKANLPQSRLFGWFPEKGVLLLDIGCAVEDVHGVGAVGYPHFINIITASRASCRSPWVAGDIRYVRNA